MEELTRRKNRQRKPHRPILEEGQEEGAENQNHPNGHVRQDPRGQRMRPDHGGPIPEQSDKSPSQRSRNDRYLNQEHGRAVVEIQRHEVEEVEDEHQLGDPEPRPHPEQDEGCL